MRFIILILLSLAPLGAQQGGTPAASIHKACAGTPGNTTGAYRQQCQTSAGALYTCNNSTGCATSGQWVAQGGVGSGVTAVTGTAHQVASSGGTTPAISFAGGGLIYDGTGTTDPDLTLTGTAGQVTLKGADDDTALTSVVLDNATYHTTTLGFNAALTRAIQTSNTAFTLKNSQGGSSIMSFVVNGVTALSLTGSAVSFSNTHLANLLSAANLTGPIASIPAAGIAGRTYLPTDSYFSQARDTGSAWAYFRDGAKMAFSPSMADLNIGSVTVNALSNGGEQLVSPGSATNNFRGRSHAQSGVFTVLVGFIPVLGVAGSGADTSTPQVGIGVTDGTTSSDKMIFFGVGMLSSSSHRGFLYITEQTLAGSSTADLVLQSYPFANGQMVWLKIAEDASNRTFYVCSGPQASGCVQVFQHPVTTFLTTANVAELIGDFNLNLPATAVYLYWVEN